MCNMRRFKYSSLFVLMLSIGLELTDSAVNYLHFDDCKTPESMKRIFIHENSTWLECNKTTGALDRFCIADAIEGRVDCVPEYKVKEKIDESNQGWTAFIARGFYAAGTNEQYADCGIAQSRKRDGLRTAKTKRDCLSSNYTRPTHNAANAPNIYCSLKGDYKVNYIEGDDWYTCKNGVYELQRCVKKTDTEYNCVSVQKINDALERSGAKNSFDGRRGSFCEKFFKDTSILPNYENELKACKDYQDGSVAPPPPPPQPRPPVIITEKPVPPAPPPAPVPRPVVAPAPRPVIAPVPRPVVAPAPSPVVAPVPRPVVAPVPRPVVAPVPRPVVAPAPRPVVAPPGPVEPDVISGTEKPEPPEGYEYYYEYYYDYETEPPTTTTTTLPTTTARRRRIKVRPRPRPSKPLRKAPTKSSSSSSSRRPSPTKTSTTETTECKIQTGYKAGLCFDPYEAARRMTNRPLHETFNRPDKYFSGGWGQMTIGEYLDMFNNGLQRAQNGQLDGQSMVEVVEQATGADKCTVITQKMWINDNIYLDIAKPCKCTSWSCRRG